jgi:hypothetical protein
VARESILSGGYMVGLSHRCQMAPSVPARSLLDESRNCCQLVKGKTISPGTRHFRPIRDAGHRHPLT